MLPVPVLVKDVKLYVLLRIIWLDGSKRVHRPDQKGREKSP